MTVATLAKEIPLTPDQALPIYAVAALLFFVSTVVFRKMLRKVGDRGGLVRSDLFGLPDFVIVAVFVVLILLALAMRWAFPSSKVGGSGLEIVSSVMLLSLPVILALLVVRGISLPAVFGVKRVGLLRALCAGGGLILLLLPVLMIVTAVTYQFLGGQAEQQEMVTKFREATKAGKQDIIWQIVLTATLIAPLTEEFIFRGYFYPVLKRLAGPIPAAIGISLLFGAVHNNAAGFPVLTALALGLTLAYEWSGSILVPMFMHACFNSIMLALMWWQTFHGATP
ncbi:MAG: CPBP family glutamic-type intramembrane protease [Chthoniobacteraceae bacterium]